MKKKIRKFRNRNHSAGKRRPQKRIAIGRKKRATELARFKATCHKYLIFDDSTFIDFIFGVVFANRQDSKPVWLYVIGPPGSGKSEILQSLTGHKTIYPISSLTSNTLISGMVKSEGGVDPSLLPKLDGKLVIVKDFTVLLKGRRDDLSAIMGQLRDAYDGTCRKVFGTGKETFYSSKFGIIAAVTGEIDRHLGTLAPLGERFLSCRLPRLTDREKRARADRASRNTKTKQMERDMRQAAHRVLDLSPFVASLDDVIRKQIADVAMLVAKARTPVQRDRMTKQPIAIPDPEVPTRLMKQFCDLAVGISMAREKREVGQCELRLVQKVGLDGIPGNKLNTLRVLAKAYPRSLDVAGVAKKLRIADSWARTQLQDLHLVDVIEKSAGLDRRNAKHAAWRLKKEYGQLLRRIWKLKNTAPNE